MKYKENIQAVAALQPDYLGFIFYEKSARNFEGAMPQIPDTIKKVGVFVDAPIDFVLEKVGKYNFKAVQLHGNESADYCKKLKDSLAILTTTTDILTTEKTVDKDKPGWHKAELPIGSEVEEPALSGVEEPALSGVEVPALSGVEVWKVFSVQDTFDFERLTPYERIVDYFLFDTKGKEKGGNGFTFDWSILNTYSSPTPFILSGGIGLEEIDQIRLLTKKELPIYGIDANSRLEDQPGLKNIKKVKQFLNNLHVRRDMA